MTPSPPGFTKPLILQGLFYLGFAHGGTHRGSPPNGGNITIKADPNNPADIQAMLQASREFWESDIGQSMKFNIDQAEPKNDELPAISNQNPSQNLQSNGAEAGIVAGTPLPDFIERFATRKKNTLAP